MLECVKKCAGRNLEKEVEIQMVILPGIDLIIGMVKDMLSSDLNFVFSMAGIIFGIVERMETGKYAD
ncbi:MAG: hypothetical protein ACLTS6_13080 [Anaerobutyricum sp.]